MSKTTADMNDFVVRSHKTIPPHWCAVTRRTLYQEVRFIQFQDLLDNPPDAIYQKYLRDRGVSLL
jgi:hypothetical protein